MSRGLPASERFQEPLQSLKSLTTTHTGASQPPIHTKNSPLGCRWPEILAYNIKTVGHYFRLTLPSTNERSAAAHWKCSHLFAVGRGTCQNLDCKSKCLLRGITLVLCLWENLALVAWGQAKAAGKNLKKEKKKPTCSLFSFRVI